MPWLAHGYTDNVGSRGKLGVELTLEELKALSGLMDRALLLDDAERARWLAEFKRGPQALLHPHLSEMLARHATMDPTFLRGAIELPGGRPLARDGTGVAVSASANLAAHGRVGPYALVREIGHGGMGAVWLAARVDGSLNRQVALKLPMMHLADTFAERFARERDILAQLTHPNIARLYDAGVSDEGQPYLALEYVEGRTFTEHCDALKLDVRQRLDRFLQVARAVQYAHAHLVIHRDLKPSNILVTDDGQVRLLDFGIAKLLDQPGGQSPETELTRLAGSALTLDYASPEQVSGQPVSTASDVYSLAVVLYQLLTGRKPYQLKRDSRAALEEAIISFEPTRMSEVARRADAATAFERAKAPAKLAHVLAGDLDTIVAKAMKKNPQQRYATMAAMAEDIERHLSGLPVQAQPESRLYFAGKFLRRHSMLVAAASAVVVALAVGLGMALWQTGIARDEARQADAAARVATLEKERADAVALAALRERDRADLQARATVAAAERADREAQIAVAQAQCADRESRAARLETERVKFVQNILVERSDPQRILQSGMEALRIAPDVEGGTGRRRAYFEHAFGFTQRLLGDAEGAVSAFATAARLLEVSEGAGSPEVALTKSQLAEALWQMLRLDETEQAAREAFEIERALRGDRAWRSMYAHRLLWMVAQRGTMNELEPYPMRCEPDAAAYFQRRMSLRDPN